MYTLLDCVHNPSIILPFYSYMCCMFVGVFVRVQMILMKKGKEHSPGFEAQPVVVEGNLDVPQQSLPQVKT